MNECISSRQSLPAELLTSTSTFNVLEVGSIELELRTIVPVNVSPGKASSVSVTASPEFTALA